MTCHDCNRPARALGLCRRCYDRDRRLALAPKGKGCPCGSGRVVYARGACKLCYEREWRRRRRAEQAPRPPCAEGRQHHAWTAKGRCVHCRATRRRDASASAWVYGVAS